MNPSAAIFRPFFCRVDALLREKQRVLVAIDGRCASGKTTLSALARERYGCPVLHMDHFFLRPEQRTSQRLAQPGGNVDCERFQKEALLPLLTGEAFAYRPYDCALGELGEPIRIPSCPLIVVEGSYSLHPSLSGAYDLKTFLSVGPGEQLRRIRARNGGRMAKRFQNEWIPMEEAYFSAFGIEGSCGLRFSTD